MEIAIPDKLSFARSSAVNETYVRIPERVGIQTISVARVEILRLRQTIILSLERVDCTSRHFAGEQLYNYRN